MDVDAIVRTPFCFFIYGFMCWEKCGAGGTFLVVPMNKRPNAKKSDESHAMNHERSPHCSHVELSRCGVSDFFEIYGFGKRGFVIIGKQKV